jgi:hypothetical protein
MTDNPKPPLLLTFEKVEGQTEEEPPLKAKPEPPPKAQAKAAPQAKAKTKGKGKAKPSETIPGVLNMADLNRLPDPEWLVHELLMRQGVSVLHGAPGTLKTFCALHIAGCTAYGLPFWPDGPVCRRGIVLYIAFEGLRAFKHRRRAWLRQKGLPVPDHDALKLINPRAYKIEDIEAVDFDFGSEAKVRNLIGIAKRLAAAENLPVVMVVVDVLKEALDRQVESTRTFTQAGMYSRLIADELKCQVLLLHHNKSNSENMRGPVSLEGAIETRIAIKTDGFTINATWKKNREGPTNFTLVFLAHKITLGVTSEGEELTSLAVETLGIAEEGAQSDGNTSKLRQIAASIKDEELSVAQLLIRLEWSKDGRGGKQRGWVDDAIGNATEEDPRVVHLAGDDYRAVWMRRQGRNVFVIGHVLTAAEVSSERERQKQKAQEIIDRLRGKKVPA